MRGIMQKAGAGGVHLDRSFHNCAQRKDSLARQPSLCARSTTKKFARAAR